MNYFLVDPTGRIVQAGTADAQFIPLLATNGLVAYEGNADPVTQYWDGKRVMNIPPKPKEGMTFDYVIKQWVDKRSLAELKDAKWEEIKTKRKELELGVFKYKEFLIDGDVESQRRWGLYTSISKDAQKAGKEFSIYFTTADNKQIFFNEVDFILIELAYVEHIAKLFAITANLRNQIYNAESKEDLDKIVW